mmetsp:Transcript_10748/g.26326  ORF Transcript_10748/g.26326 Transcript_10748/m.26326 type:complete len:294 (+) Transcript_10748:103-984(+)|eukprot:CAMPEP_0206233874 /NCGR_PEP_ID=MMETSP0047_2-20121206/12259_1 /ASSEMBLY_ACC=CAM_ASM_000192 /TAXON_ID=195065 /ORGANISM="Chroomonas mesostigmatica_cf, Strain CCMP1168" /LENGTH=293 /DNA_ID=CAMNT_0053657861 /DNA_START=65 /DNA_END=946 /DNA_ORIENTATION=-
MMAYDRCCCSHFTGAQGTLPWCCGPPIRAAARGACIFLAILSLPGILQGISVVFVGDQDVCLKTSPDNVVIASLVISVVAILIYGWGVWVAHTGSVVQAQLLWKAHSLISCLSVLVGVCISGNYAKSPRRKDLDLDAICEQECRANTELSDRPSFFGDPCGIPEGAAQGWIAAAISAMVWGYFAFVLWSFATRAKQGTMNLGNMEMAVMAPMAMPHQDYVQATAIPTAVPVAMPVAVGVATAVPVASDLHSSTSPPYNENEPFPAYNAEARYEHAQPPPAYATAPEGPPRFLV